MTRLALECHGIHLEELEKVSQEKEVWLFMLRLLSLQQIRRWMDGWIYGWKLKKTVIHYDAQMSRRRELENFTDIDKTNFF